MLPTFLFLKFVWFCMSSECGMLDWVGVACDAGRKEGEEYKRVWLRRLLSYSYSWFLVSCLFSYRVFGVIGGQELYEEWKDIEFQGT